MYNIITVRRLRTDDLIKRGKIMEISELRQITRLSQRQFAEYFGIPIGTLRNWEQGISKPPEYVFQMIVTSIRRDVMINVETIKFVNMLNELAALSNNGIEPFENATEETYRNQVFYDTRLAEDEKVYRVVLDACICDDPDCYHHDVISYYDSDSFEYKIRVKFDDEDKETGAYICVELSLSEEIIVIENGHWYFA